MNKIYRVVSVFALISVTFMLGTLFFRSDYWQSFWNQYKDIPVERWPAEYLLVAGVALMLLMSAFMAVFNRIRYEVRNDY